VRRARWLDLEPGERIEQIDQIGQDDGTLGATGRRGDGATVREELGPRDDESVDKDRTPRRTLVLRDTRLCLV
jgi:hypothetical protein